MRCSVCRSMQSVTVHFWKQVFQGLLATYVQCFVPSMGYVIWLICSGGMFARRAPGYLCIQYPGSSPKFILT